MSLFEFHPTGFITHSGKVSNFKIECDALSNNDIETMLRWADEIGLIPSYKRVIGIPTGGERIAAILEDHVKPPDNQSEITLVVDDVMTTGKSMTKHLHRHKNSRGFVLFSRRSPIMNVAPLFSLYPEA